MAGFGIEPRRGATPWALLLIGAGVLTALTAAQHWVVMQIDARDPSWRTLRHALTSEAPEWVLWVLAGPLVVGLIKWIPLQRGRLLVAVPAHAVIAIAVVLSHQAALLASHRILGFPIGPRPFWEIYTGSILYRIPIGLLGYLILFGAILAAEYHARYRERDLAAAALGRELAEARLAALRMQLNPHFLFNTMNTIAMLVRQGRSSEAVQMLADLSGILRHVLSELPAEETPLRDELAFIERYLDLERARFRDRLEVTIDAEPATLDAMVPNLILQPLVENAIKHGIAKRARAGRVGVTARRVGEALVLVVTDDGPGPLTVNAVTPASGIPVSSGGIGLANTASRLDQLYGSRGRVELESGADGGAVARVTLPFHAAPAALEVVEAVAS